MKTTIKFTVTVESNIGDCYDLRDSIAASLIGHKQAWCTEDDNTRIELLFTEVIMPKAGHYSYTPINKIKRFAKSPSKRKSCSQS